MATRLERCRVRVLTNFTSRRRPVPLRAASERHSDGRWRRPDAERALLVWIRGLAKADRESPCDQRPAHAERDRALQRPARRATRRPVHARRRSVLGPSTAAHPQRADRSGAADGSRTNGRTTSPGTHRRCDRRASPRPLGSDAYRASRDLWTRGWRRRGRRRNSHPEGDVVVRQVGVGLRRSDRCPDLVGSCPLGDHTPNPALANPAYLGSR